MAGRWLRDREVPGSNPALITAISLIKKCIPHLPLSTQVYTWYYYYYYCCCCCCCCCCCYYYYYYDYYYYY
ncbi:hypothetical protein DPMN_057352 [Dreissena polymorpha]|uniref:Uncharacterized protein n=1 Tax=Dreissena polymorpha TaxID=45954 RepID=A0A9D4HE09_DREPO|nr:hypothetical protein DPMN_057352 [Dreissena polymorpha]